MSEQKKLAVVVSNRFILAATHLNRAALMVRAGHKKGAVKHYKFAMMLLDPYEYVAEMGKKEKRRRKPKPKPKAALNK